MEIEFYKKHWSWANKMDMSILQVHSTNTKLGVYAVKVSTLPKYKTIEKRNMIKKNWSKKIQ